MLQPDARFSRQQVVLSATYYRRLGWARLVGVEGAAAGAGERRLIVARFLDRSAATSAVGVGNLANRFSMPG